MLPDNKNDSSPFRFMLGLTSLHRAAPPIHQDPIVEEFIAEAKKKAESTATTATPPKNKKAAKGNPWIFKDESGKKKFRKGDKVSDVTPIKEKKHGKHAEREKIIRDKGKLDNPRLQRIHDKTKDGKNADGTLTPEEIKRRNKGIQKRRKAQREAKRAEKSGGDQGPKTAVDQELAKRVKEGWKGNPWHDEDGIFVSRPEATSMSTGEGEPDYTPHHPHYDAGGKGGFGDYNSEKSPDKAKKKECGRRARHVKDDHLCREPDPDDNAEKDPAKKENSKKKSGSQKPASGSSTSTTQKPKKRKKVNSAELTPDQLASREKKLASRKKANEKRRSDPEKNKQDNERKRIKRNAKKGGKKENETLSSKLLLPVSSDYLEHLARDVNLSLIESNLDRLWSFLTEDVS